MRNQMSITIFLLAILIAACTSNAPQDTLPKSRVVVCLLDFTGSFEYLGESVDKLASSVDELSPGDEFVACTIDGSNSGQRILQVKLPRSTRAIDHNNQRRIHTMKLKLKQLLSSINTRQESRSTDLLGPIYAASRLFGKASDKQKFLLLFTDLEDNVGQTIPRDGLDLRDVKVIAFFMSPKSIQEDIRTRSMWTAFFQEAGAGFEMFNVIESRSQSQILVPGGASQ